jgi:hypothetical protein
MAIFLFLSSLKARATPRGTETKLALSKTLKKEELPIKALISIKLRAIALILKYLSDQFNLDKLARRKQQLRTEAQNICGNSK